MDAGHDVSDIAAVTGHKSNESLRKYASFKRETQIKSFSQTLSSSLHKRKSESDIQDEIPAIKQNLPAVTPMTTVSMDRPTCAPTCTSINMDARNQLSAIFGSGNSISINTLNINFNK